MPDYTLQTITHAELASQAKGPRGEVYIKKDLPAALTQVGLKAIDAAFVRVVDDELTFSVLRGSNSDDLLKKVAPVLNDLLKARQSTKTVYHELLYRKIHSRKGNLRFAQEEFVKLLNDSPYGQFLGITLKGVGQPHGNPKVIYNAPHGMAGGELIRLCSALCERLETRLPILQQQAQDKVTYRGQSLVPAI
jgi:hypothetical protein